MGALLFGLIVWQGLFSSAPGSLMLELSPADARVILPDINKPCQPGMALSDEYYWVVARRAGYKELSQPIRIRTGRRTTVSIKLDFHVGAVFRDALESGGEGPQMVVLPTGRFRMSSPAGESGRDSDEGPQRTVTISQGIAMGRHEVMFADYDRFVSATGGARPDDEGWDRGRRPVINVSREDAQAYATWLSAQTGKACRLPSESEWEYAARAGTETA